MLILFALLVILVNAAVLFYIFSLLAESPFIGVPYNTLPEIIAALEIKDGEVFYDIGCGDGRVLVAAWRAQPNGRYIGVEKSIAPFARAWFRKMLIGNPKNITLIYANMYSLNYSEANKVFTYLFPGPVQKVWDKLRFELKPGSRLVSCQFRPEQKANIEIILKNHSEIAKKLYIYDL